MKYKKHTIYGSIIFLIIIIVLIINYTYGFLGSKINGNTNDKTVIVDLNNNSVEFTDLSQEIDALIEPGYENVQLFTIKNLGASEVNFQIFLDEVTNTFARKKDLKYYVYKKDGNNSIDINNLSTSTLINSGTYPSSNNYIAKNVTQAANSICTYAFKVEYVNSDENQDSNKGKIFQGRIQLHPDILPGYNSTLADTIIDNAKNVTTEQKSLLYAEYSETPKSTPASDVSADDEATLSKTTDDDGDSYYFRGNVKNNYVTFAGMCWRIVRIEGDGAVKIILEDKDTPCSTSTLDWNIGTSPYGYEEVSVGKIPKYENGMKILLNSWYNSNLLNNYDSYIKTDKWCIGNIDKIRDYWVNYTPRERMSNKTPSLVCSDIYSTDKIGALTVDEGAYAGYVDSYSKSSENVYLYVNNSFALISASYYDDSKQLAFTYTIYSSIFRDEKAEGVAYPYNIRPVITLLPGTDVSDGDGSKTNSYIID